MSKLVGGDGRTHIQSVLMRESLQNRDVLSKTDSGRDLPPSRSWDSWDSAPTKCAPPAGPEQDLETVRQMRNAVGPDFDLMVDAHSWWRMGDSSYSPATVEQLARDMSAYRIAWLEEPLPPDDHAAYLALKEKDLVPLATGEHEPNEDRYLDLILTQAVDYIQMDVCCQGGFAMGRRLFAEIARQGLSFAFHSWGTALEVIAAAHLGICWPEMIVEWLEYPCYSSPGRAGMYPFPLAAEILTEPLPNRTRRSDRPAHAGPGRHGRRIGDRTLPLDPGPVVLLPDRFAGRESRGHQRSQRAVGQAQRALIPGCGAQSAGINANYDRW